MRRTELVDRDTGKLIPDRIEMDLYYEKDLGEALERALGLNIGDLDEYGTGGESEVCIFYSLPQENEKFKNYFPEDKKVVSQSLRVDGECSNATTVIFQGYLELEFEDNTESTILLESVKFNYNVHTKNLKMRGV